MGNSIRIGALVSGGGSNLQAIIDACGSGAVDGDVVFVAADTPGAGGLERARRHGIPTFVCEYRKIFETYREDPAGFKLPDDFDPDLAFSRQGLFNARGDRREIAAFLATRAAAESRLLEGMAGYPFDLLVLAGFMRKLSPYIIDRINTDPSLPRIMNIHPALLPAFPGTDGYGDTVRYGCKVGGCTVHFVDYGEDTGPIIGQRAFAIRPDDTLETVRARGLRLEWELYPACIQLFAENRLKVVEKSHPGPGGGVFIRKVVRIT
ncbi:MAG: phosphoribosylglycinamide formyltransferase [Deltaproteobacteria bacterium]|nr:phosphoribosylglycinamide formyltransferase [Deltaproteobacteria bacterium]